MNTLSPHAQRVLEWREHFSFLPESRFFEIIRMYLGNVQTPFNKQKLIEELGAFLRKGENREVILSLLEREELELLAAVKFIEKPTGEKLLSFFKDSYPYAFIFDKTLNLEERLLIYTFKDKQTGEQYLRLNPMFDDAFDELLVPSVLLRSPELSREAAERTECVSPELLAAFVAFIYENSDLTKADGTFKKRAAAEIAKRFGAREELLHSVLISFLNLSVARESERGVMMDGDALESFAALPDVAQRLYLCVSLRRHLSRYELVRRASVLFGTLRAIPEGGYTKAVIMRASRIFLSRAAGVPDSRPFGSHSRFSSILSRFGGADGSAGDDFSGDSVTERVIDAAVRFGLLVARGKTAQGEDVFVPSPSVRDADERAFRAGGEAAGEAKKVLTVDSGLSVRVMPGLSFLELLRIVRFLEIREVDTALTFEMTKNSCVRGFDFGLSVDDIVSLLSSHSCYELPQNLRVSVDDWHSSYAAAALFKGYVLRVESDRIAVIENNPKLKRNVLRVLAPGVYLLDVTSDREASYVVSSLGFENTGKITSNREHAPKTGLPPFRPEEDETAALPAAEGVGGAAREAVEEHLSAMRSALRELPLTAEQEEGLLLRINRKIVLSPKQLKGETVRFERVEASGMDFPGKLHVIDSAISDSAMLEIELSNPDVSKNESAFILGRPLSIEKAKGVSCVRVRAEPEKDERLLDIGRISFVKKIRCTIF